MIQLRIQIPGLGWNYLDLYDTDPPRITLAFDSFESFKPQSSYSQSFRLPATDNNYLYFKTAFDVNGYDFDVTIKREAEILVDGDDFLHGELRLVKIYNSNSNTDYECVFYGDTRGLLSSIGNKKMRDLNLSALNHSQSMNNVDLSWSAYPSTTNLTGGLLSGNVVYPLVDFGSTYNDAEAVQEVSISVGSGLHITNNALPSADKIWADRFKPMVRLKYLLDKVFDEADCTYTSNFLGDQGQTPGFLPFYRTYLTCWGNEDSIYCPVDSDKTLVTISNPITYTSSGAFQNVDFNNISYDFNESWDAENKRYVSQINALIPFAVKLYGTATSSGSIVIRYNGTVLTALTGTFGAGQVSYYETFQLNLTAGDIIEVEVNPSDEVEFTSGFFRTEFEADINIASLIQEDYKQIDFLKDVLTAYKLVMVPDRITPNKYIIEPWVNFIGRGDVYDWTYKLDTSKDFVIEPIFYSQDASIDFKTVDDADWLNDVNKKTFKENFGELHFDTDNDLLSGTKTVELKIASTPVTEIQGANQNTGGGATDGMDNMIIPHIYKLDPGDTKALKEPIVPKSRFLFYNGLKETGIQDTTPTTNSWYWRNDAGTTSSSTYFPMATPYQYMPYPYESGADENSFALDLNWQVENGYLRFGTLNQRTSLYDNYWVGYTSLLYDTWSRRVTAYFVLSQEELFDFNFDDVVFVKDAYYYVEKIENLVIGSKESVKVSLIKLLNYNPPQGGFIPPFEGLVWEEVNTNWEALTDDWGAF